MHLTLKRPLLAMGKVKWLSAPAVMLSIWSLFGILTENPGWLLIGGLFISPVCFVCSSLVLSHTLTATGSTLFRIVVVIVNVLGLVFASLWLIGLVFNVYSS
jgi:hypothetical protein